MWFRLCIRTALRAVNIKSWQDIDDGKAPGDSFQTLLEFANKLVDKFVGFLLHVSF
jgi:hypothetical protein